jgi:hypothetical protein
MAELYDNIRAVNAEYVPRFVGSNYEQLNQAAQVLDARYRENKAYSDKVAMALAQEQYLDSDKQIKDDLAQSIYGQINDIGSSDENFENSTAAVSQLARDFFTNQNRLRALDNYKRVEQAKALRTQLGAEALNFGDNPDAFSTLDPETGEARTFNNGIERRADYSRKMQELLGRVADDGYSIDPSGQKIKFDDYERYLIRSGQVNKIDGNKLNRLVEGLIPSYKASAEGKQDIRRLTELAGYRNAPMRISDGRTTRQTTDVDEDIRQRFRAVAAPQQFNKSAIRWDDFGIKPDKPASPDYYTSTQPGSVTDNSSLEALPNADEAFNPDYMYQLDNGQVGYYVDATGQPVSKQEVPQSTGGRRAQEAVQQVMDQKGYKFVRVDKAAIEQQQNQTYGRLTSQFPQIANYYGNIEEFKKAYNSAVKQHAKVTPVGYRIEPEQAKIYDDLITRSSAASPIYFKDAATKPKSLDELAKDLDTNPSNISFKAINLYYDSPSKDIPGGYVEAKVEVNDKDAKRGPSTVFLPLNDQFRELAYPIDQVLKNSLYKGSDTYTIDRPLDTGLTAADGSRLAVYTVTYPKRVEDQGSNKVNFDTYVFEGDIVPNGSGGETVEWKDTPTKIGDWRNQMIRRISPKLENVLNTGQTYSGKDVKERGLDF